VGEEARYAAEFCGSRRLLVSKKRVIDGIESSDDPVLAARRGVYEVWVAYRTGGWKGPTGRSGARWLSVRQKCRLMMFDEFAGREDRHGLAAGAFSMNH
jgi:hypothetical protein